jgi:hypothetical protein
MARATHLSISYKKPCRHLSKEINMTTIAAAKVEAAEFRGP